jgi:hypothetical protein
MQRVERYEAERDAWTANPKQCELEEIEADIAHARQHLTANPRGDERGTTMETDNAR